MTFQQIITDLVACGLTQTEIATKCLTSQTNISGLMLGSRKEPRYSLGLRLVELHREQIRPTTPKASA